jgi:hypothetical protein
VRMDLRWASGDINRIRALAQELVGLQPDIILAGGTPGTSPGGPPDWLVAVRATSVAGPSIGPKTGHFLTRGQRLPPFHSNVTPSASLMRL